MQCVDDYLDHLYCLYIFYFLVLKGQIDSIRFIDPLFREITLTFSDDYYIWGQISLHLLTDFNSQDGLKLYAFQPWFIFYLENYYCLI